MRKKQEALPHFTLSGWRLLGVLMVVLVSFFIPLVGVIVCLALLTLLLGYFKKFTLLEATGLAILVFFSITFIFYSLVTLFHAHFLLEYAPVLFLSLGVLLMRWRFKNSLPKPAWATRKKSDVISLVIALSTFLLLLIPVFHKSPSYIAQFLSYGEDNASHYALSRYINHNDSLTYNQTAEQAGLIYSLEVYPQGFHVNAALFASLMKPLHFTEEKFIRLYAVFIAIMYTLFVFWLIKLCTYAIEKVSWVIAISAIPALALAGAFSFFLLMLDRGFQPQVFAFAYLLAVLFVVMMLPEKKTVAKAMLLITILSVGIAASWWFLLFIVFIVGLFYLWKLRDLSFLKNIRFLVALALPLFGILYPILVNLILSKKVDPLSEPGGVDVLPLDFLLWVGAASFILPIVIRLKDKTLHYLYIALGSSLLLAGLIGAYHLTHVGHLEYYFHKTIYSVLALLVIIASIGVTHLANKLFHFLPKYIRLIIPTAFVGIVVAIAVASNLVFLKVYVNNWFPNAVEFVDTPLLFTNKTDSYKDILFVGDCSAASDYLSNRWSGARLLSESADRSKVTTNILKADWEKTNTYLAEYMSHHKDILLSIDRRCEDKLPVLRQLANYPDVTAVYTH